MAIDIDACLGSSLDIVLDGVEVHVTIAIDTTGHLHGVAGNGLREVLVDQLVNCRLLEIVVDDGTRSKLEVRILGIIDVLLESLVIVQVTIVVVVGFSQLECLLCEH